MYICHACTHFMWNLFVCMSVCTLVSAEICLVHVYMGASPRVCFSPACPIRGVTFNLLGAGLPFKRKLVGRKAMWSRH